MNTLGQILPARLLDDHFVLAKEAAESYLSVIICACNNGRRHPFSFDQFLQDIEDGLGAVFLVQQPSALNPDITDCKTPVIDGDNRGMPEEQAVKGQTNGWPLAMMPCERHHYKTGMRLCHLVMPGICS
jgi:hypothetical protein